MQQHRITPAIRVLALFVLCVLLSMLIRSIWTFPLDDQDSVWKYRAAAELARGGQGLSVLLENQHTARWSQVIPQALLTAITGPRYFTMQLLPLAAFSVYFCLLLFVMRPHLNHALLGLLAVLLLTQPQMFRATNELLNPAFGVMYVALGSWLLSLSRTPGWWVYPVAAALFLLAYASHVSYLGFAAGAAVFIGYRHSLAAAAQFTFWLAVLIVAETLVFNHVSQGALTFGRLELIATRPQTIGRLEAPYAYSGADLLSRWVNAPAVEVICLVGYVATAITLLCNRRLRNLTPDFVLCMILCAGAAGLGLTFLVIDRVNLTPGIPLNPRYVTVFIPFAIIGFIWGLALLLRATRWPYALVHLASLALLACLLLAPAALATPGGFATIKIRPEAFIWKSDRVYRQFDWQVRSGQLVIEGKWLDRNVLRALVAYAKPVRLIRDGQRYYSPRLRTDALCLRDLSQAARPHLRYTCQPAPALPAPAAPGQHLEARP